MSEQNLVWDSPHTQKSRNVVRHARSEILPLSSDRRGRGQVVGSACPQPCGELVGFVDNYVSTMVTGGGANRTVTGPTTDAVRCRAPLRRTRTLPRRL